MTCLSRRTERSETALIQTWAMLAICVLIAGIAAAQEDVDRPVELEKTLLDDKAIAPEPTAASDAVSTKEAEKKRKASAGLAAVGAIAILGVGIIAATMIWARRLRRLARDSGPVQRTAGNDFWFLKPPKPIATETQISNVHRPPLGEQRDDEA